MGILTTTTAVRAWARANKLDPDRVLDACHRGGGATDEVVFSDYLCILAYKRCVPLPGGTAYLTFSAD